MRARRTGNLSFLAFMLGLLLAGCSSNDPARELAAAVDRLAVEDFAAEVRLRPSDGLSTALAESTGIDPFFLGPTLQQPIQIRRVGNDVLVGLGGGPSPLVELRAFEAGADDGRTYLRTNLTPSLTLLGLTPPQVLAALRDTGLDLEVLAVANALLRDEWVELDLGIDELAEVTGAADEDVVAVRDLLGTLERLSREPGRLVDRLGEVTAGGEQGEALVYDLALDLGSGAGFLAGDVALQLAAFLGADAGEPIGEEVWAQLDEVLAGGLTTTVEQDRVSQIDLRIARRGDATERPSSPLVDRAASLLDGLGLAATFAYDAPASIDAVTATLRVEASLVPIVVGEVRRLLGQLAQR